MENIAIKIIDPNNILDVVPLLKQLNKKTSEKLLKERLLEMVTQNYECAVMYYNNELVGVCGI